MTKLVFCISKSKDADQLRSNREDGQRLCFRYIDSRIPLIPKYEISSLWPSSVVVQPGLCGTWSETPNTGFLTTRLISFLCFLISKRVQKANTTEADRGHFTILSWTGLGT